VARRSRVSDPGDPNSKTGERVRVAQEQLDQAREHLELARKRLRKALDADHPAPPSGPPLPVQPARRIPKSG
jgi:hypothetical protein